MNADPYDDLLPHVDHRLTLVPLGDEADSPDSISIYCQECNEVIADFDRPVNAEGPPFPSCDEVEEAAWAYARQLTEEREAERG